jgi:dipeptidyl aminopeptidase/acylaminoacyl peptidase
MGLTTRVWVRFFARISVGLMCAASALSVQSADLIPVSDFFRFDAFGEATMSPSGNHVAAVVRVSKTNRNGLVVFDSTDLSKTKAVALFADMDVVDPVWVNDERLVFKARDLQAEGTAQWGYALYAVDRQGKDSPQILIRRRLSEDEDYGVVAAKGTRLQSEKGLSPFHRFHSVLRDGSSDILVTRTDYAQDGELSGRFLFRQDTISGKVRPLAADSPPNTSNWLVDTTGVPRVAFSASKGVSRIHWRPNPSSEWKLLGESKQFDGDGGPPTPIAIDSSDRIYARGRVGKGDKTELLRSDMTAGELKWQAIVSVDGYDFRGQVLVDPDGKLVGIRTLTDARSTTWVDPALKAIQADIDQRLPGLINEISCGLCKNVKKVLVRSWSDRQPVIFVLYDLGTKSLTIMGNSRPSIKSAQMARREMMNFKARDGLTIPVHITRPQGHKAPGAAVVLVHGGPYVRGGEWEWDADSQFLASRGYVVIEPEFRGSTGFGENHFRKGWKQWGLAMQDDIADATEWAIKQGWVDSGRVCIAGASYGGYAAMMGLVRHSNLYQCGINWVGVTDIDLLYTARWSDLSDAWKTYGMPNLVGDRVADAEQIKATSPLRQADKIKRPVLLAYGNEDTRVPIRHGVNLRNALKRHNENVEWIVYEKEGHGWLLEETQFDFWKRVEAFLAKHLRTR